MEKFLWVEKHRPTKVDDCILPTNLKQTFQEFVKDNQIPNLILSISALKPLKTVCPFELSFAT